MSNNGSKFADRKNNRFKWKFSTNGKENRSLEFKRSVSSTQTVGKNDESSRRRAEYRNTARSAPRTAYPISEVFLREILNMKKDMVVLELLRPHSGYAELIKRRDCPKPLISLVIRILAKASKCNMITANLQNILEMTMQAELRNVLVEMADTPEGFEIIPHVYEVCECIMQKCSVSSSDLILPVLSAYTFTCAENSHPLSKDFSALREHARARNSQHLQVKQSTNTFNVQPPDDFRLLSVIPTIEELLEPNRPFIRANRIQGSYQNLEDYLDVQFRLLKEDFCAPMREGIAHIVSGSKNRNYSFFFYKCVEAQGRDVVTWEIVWKFKIKNMRVNQISNKRLMVGNVVCLSNDNFQTIHVGYIFHVDERTPFEFHVKFSSDSDVIKAENYSMIETRALFVAYKHVLQSIQKKTVLPFQQEIVHCTGNNGPPDYLKGKVLDLGCLEARRYAANSRLSDWPSCEDLHLNESQRESIHGVFNNKVAVVQGPPGTGKTYIGLKITQIIFDSFKQNDIGPIVVVAYTNHALDQFLEEVLKFTKNITRVGSRSKSEELWNYNIKNRVINCSKRREFPQSIVSTNAGRQGLAALRSQIDELRLEIEALKNPKGIFSERIIFGDHAPFSPIKSDVSSWLVDPQVVLPFSVLSSDEYLEDSMNWREMCRMNQSESRERESQDKCDDWALKESRRDVHCYEIKREDVEKNIQILEQKISKYHEAYNKSKSKYDRNTVLEKIWQLENECRTENEFMRILCAGLSVKTVDSSEDIGTVDFVKRWSIYNWWVQNAITAKVDKLHKLIQDGEYQFQEQKEIEAAQELYVMRQSRIVGLTTTGASRLTTLLDQLTPKIVIIEEAAEILEGHCIAPLSEGCEHLILIGDHMQLRPSTCVYDLARNFHLDVSLFERLIKNGHKYYSLSVQHRMRPEISQLVASTLYPELVDHKSVLSRPSIKGMENDLFFFTHDHKENISEEDSSSHKNEAEAHFVMALCCHLRNQNYKPSQITILTAYMGQLMLLRQLQKQNHRCSEVRISTVDNFQGEENDIILLSLVRNNDAGKVGFLATDNRACVALSRARNGLYVFGNMDHLTESSVMWQKVNDLLRINNLVGSAIGIRCFNHPFEVQKIQRPEQFMELSPNGGCTSPCSFVYDVCGHLCQRICHIDEDDHAVLPCLRPCSKLICDLGHPCPKKCADECPPCMENITKVLLCGHSAEIPCSHSIDTYSCQVIVTRTMEKCEHAVEMKCSQSADTFKCKEQCTMRLECGHVCTGTCHAVSDPDHEDYVCGKPCTRNARDCSLDHKCQQKCGESCPLCLEKVTKTAPCGHPVPNVICHKPPKCTRKCEKVLECGHECSKKCFAPCQPCSRKVDKISEVCGHIVKVDCGAIPRRMDCLKQCEKVLPCGHKCDNLCRQSCTTICSQKTESSHRCPQGHDLRIFCNETIRVPLWKLNYTCTEPCKTELSCGHFCKGTCGDCSLGRLHVVCEEKCERTLICGHICQQPCAVNCPPCQEKCELRCKHSECKQRCSYDCTDCSEPCESGCDHVKCKKLCREICDRDACKLPCKKKLECGHDCIGFCGDPCPRLCRICHREELLAIMISGVEDEPDSRFVELPRCKHVIEESALETWLSMEREEIGCAKCPHCRSPIFNLPRYRKFINRAMSDMRAVRKKLHAPTAEAMVTQLDGKLNSLSCDISSNPGHRTYDSKTLNRILNSIKAKLPRRSRKNKRKIKLDSLEVNLFTFQCDFVKEYISIREKLYDKHPDTNEQFEFECERLIKIVHDLKLQCTESRQQEISSELQRLTIIRPLLQLSPSIKMTKKQLHDEIWFLINTRKFTEKIESELRKHMVAFGSLTEAERVSVVKAMGFKPGHWFKCPNGHFYCIGECGGASEISVCPECKEKIGGTSHRLLTTNSHAREFDDSTFPAWSERANMINYRV